MAGAWLIAWATAVLLLLGVLVGVNAIAEYRRLRRLNAPKAMLILWQRSVARLIPGRARQGDLAGRLVWLAWDLRWAGFGQSTARIVALGEGNELSLRLDTPIVVGGYDSIPEVRMETVRFLPHRRSVPRYGQCVVSGGLKPPVSPGVYATARIIVYPAGD